MAKHPRDLACGHRCAVARGPKRFTGVSVNDGRGVGLVESDGEVHEQPIPSRRRHRVQALARDLLTPYDKSAGLLLFGALGLLALLALVSMDAEAGWPSAFASVAG